MTSSVPKFRTLMQSRLLHVSLLTTNRPLSIHSCVAQGPCDTLSLEDSVFTGNTAQTSGGGWAAFMSNTLSLQNCIFTSNTASVSESASPSFSTQLLTTPEPDKKCRSLCADSGGGVLINTWGNATIQNVTFASNQALGIDGTACSDVQLVCAVLLYKKSQLAASPQGLQESLPVLLRPAA